MRNYVTQAVWQSAPPVPSWLGRVSILWFDDELLIDCYGTPPPTAARVIAAALHRLLVQNDLGASLVMRDGTVVGVTWGTP